MFRIFSAFSVFAAITEGRNQERIDINYTEDEVYPLSEDEDILSKELDQLQEITTKHCLKIPVAVMVFNPGMWGEIAEMIHAFRLPL